MCTGSFRGLKKASDPLVLELQAFVNYLMWTLEMELGSSRRAAGVLNHRAVSPTPALNF